MKFEELLERIKPYNKHNLYTAIYGVWASCEYVEITHTKPLGFINLNSPFIGEHIIGLLPYQGNPELPSSCFITHISPHCSGIRVFNSCTL